MTSHQIMGRIDCSNSTHKIVPIKRPTQCFYVRLEQQIKKKLKRFNLNGDEKPKGEQLSIHVPPQQS